MILGQPYETSDEIYRKSYIWALRSESITYNDRHGTLTIFISTNGRSISPDYNKLSGALQKHSHALLNISITDWNFDLAHPSILTDHLKMLYFNISRWQAIRFDAQLFNYFVQKREWREILEFEIPSSLKSVTLSDLGEASQGNIAPLTHALGWLFNSVVLQKFPHLEIEGTGVFEPLDWNQARRFPFSNLCVLHLTAPISAFVVHHILISSRGAIQELFVSDLIGPWPSEVAKAVVPGLRILRLSLSEIDFENNRCGSVWQLLTTLVPVGDKLQEVSLGYENKWSPKCFATFCERIGPSGLVGTLRLEKMGMTCYQFLQCVELNPNLFELVVDCQLDRWNGDPPPLLFTEEICDLFMVKPQFTHLVPGLEKLVVRENCIARTGHFGEMIESMYTEGSLKELVILGKNAISRLHRQDKKIFKQLAKTGFSVRFQD